MPEPSSALEPDLSLEAQIGQLTHGDHVCMIYENRDEQLAATIPFLRDGLRKNERCVYIADEVTLQEARAALETIGIEVEHESQRGALRLLTQQDAYLQAGDFEPGPTIDFLGKAVDAAQQEGFTGLRVTGEMSWALGCEHGCQRLVEYEARLNRFFPGSRSLAICQYNRNRFSPRVIHDILRTHPQAVVGKHVCSNLYYEPPEAMLSETGMAEKVERMLQQLQRAREIELKVIAFNQEMEAKVAAKTASVEEARDQLQVFCYTMAHDLRAPLRAIETYGDLLIEEFGTQLPPEGAGYLERMRRAAIRVQALVNDLLTYSKILNKDLEPEQIDLAAAVSEIVAEFSQTDLGGRASIEVKCREGVVLGHRATLSVIVGNLLSNAVKFVAKGDTPRLVVSLEDLDDRMRVSVADNGIGVAPAAQDRLFKPFERVHSDRSVEGTGMGLAIVQKGAERMGGTVGMESVPLRGSRFWFELRKAALPAVAV
jgi:signal transduction histidine kinase